MFVELVGVGIATGIGSNPDWTKAYNTSSGALLNACFDGFGGFGSFCVVILALGAIQNNTPSTYVAALSIQTLGRYAKVVPRWAWCIFIMLVELVCSVAGRNNLYGIFENFLPIMAYWVCPWLTIVIEEHVIFHVLMKRPFDWTIWEDKNRLPLGAAAMTAWLIGWAGAILGMAQLWYTGPIALEVGGWGGTYSPEKRFTEYRCLHIRIL
jgi:purine-cytosine permease-like protein